MKRDVILWFGPVVLALTVPGPFVASSRKLSASDRTTKPAVVAGDVPGSLVCRGRTIALPNVIAFEELRSNGDHGNEDAIVISVIFSDQPISREKLLLHFESHTALEPREICFSVNSYLKLRYAQDGELIDCCYGVHHDAKSCSGGSFGTPDSAPGLTVEKVSDVIRVSGSFKVPPSKESDKTTCSATFSSELLTGRRIVAEKVRIASQPAVRQGIVEGEVVIHGKTHKLTHAVAYETRSPAASFELVSDASRKASRTKPTRTCVLLSCEAVPITDLQTSLRKDGTDEGMRLYRPYVRFYFTQTGQPYSVHIQSRGGRSFIGNDKLGGAIRTNDGRVSGTCSMSEGAPQTDAWTLRARYEADFVFQFAGSR